LNVGFRLEADGRCGAEIKQTVRKLASRAKNVAQSSVSADFSGSDRPEAAKIRLNSAFVDQSTQFSHGLQDFCDGDFRPKIGGR